MQFPDDGNPNTFNHLQRDVFDMGAAEAHGSKATRRRMSSPDRAMLRLCKARLNPFKITQQALRDQPHQGKCESWCLMKGDNNRVLVNPVDLDIAQTDGGGSPNLRGREEGDFAKQMA